MSSFSNVHYIPFHLTVTGKDIIAQHQHGRDGHSGGHQHQWSYQKERWPKLNDGHQSTDPAPFHWR